MRSSLFDALDAGELLPRDGVGYGRMPTTTPSAAAPPKHGRRMGVVLTIVIGLSSVALVGLFALARRLFS